MLTLRTQPGAVRSLERTFSLCFKKYVEDLPAILGLTDILLIEKFASLVEARGKSPPNLNYRHLVGATTLQCKSPSVQGTQQLPSHCGFGNGHQKPELRVRVTRANKDWKENYGGDCQGGVDEGGTVVL